MTYIVVEDKDLEKVADVLEAAFYTNPLHRAMLKERLKVPLEDNLDFEATKGTFKERIFQLKKEGADIVHSNDFTAVAVWLRPNLKMSPPPITALVQEFKDKMQALKDSHGYTDRADWHLLLIARDQSKISKGSVRRLIEPYLQKAKDEKTGASVVAIDQRAREIYEYFGFKVVDSFKLGENRLDRDGLPDPNGEGLEVTYLVYDV